MSRLFAAATLFVLSASPALARDLPPLALPEPDTLLLLGIAAAGLVFSLTKKKK